MNQWQNTDLSTRMALAAAEDTPSDVLQQLGTDADKEVRRTVAGNPNAPTNTLLRLGETFPDEITANPIFLIQMLAEPESRFVRLSLARSSTTSEHTFAQLSEIPDEEILCAIARNLTTPPRILEKLVRHCPQLRDNSKYNLLFLTVAKNPHTPSDVLSYLSKIRSRYRNLELALAENQNTSPDILEELARVSSSNVYLALLRNLNLPDSIVETLAGENNREVRAAVKVRPQVSQTATAICNFIDGKPGTPAEILEKLAGDRRSHIRRLVAQYPETPASVLSQLIADPDKDNVFPLAHHPNLPAEALEKLAWEWLAECQESADTRYWSGMLSIALHPNVTAAALDHLADAIDLKGYQLSGIVTAIAQNEKTPFATFIKLAKHFQDKPDSWSVHKALANNPNTPPEALEILLRGLLASNRPIGAAYSYLMHPRIPASCLEDLATHPSESVRCAVARNQKTPPDILEMLAKSQEYNLAHVVAENPQIPLELLQEFAHSPDSWVRKGLAQNPNLPLKTIEMLAEDRDPEVRARLAKNNCIPLDILNRLAQDPLPRVRDSIVDNPLTPVSLLLDRIDSPDPAARCKLVEHPKTSPAMLLTLSRDEDFIIRQIATRAFNNLSEGAIADLAESTLAQSYANIANNCGVNIEYSTLEWLAQHPKTPEWLFELLASNEPTELYDLLGEAYFSRLRSLVARNTSAPIDLLQKLANDAELGKDGVAKAALETLRQISSGLTSPYDRHFTSDRDESLSDIPF